MKLLRKITNITQIENSTRDFYKYVQIQDRNILEVSVGGLEEKVQNSAVYAFPEVGVDYSLELAGFQVEDYAGSVSLFLNVDCAFSLVENNEAFRDFLLKLELENPNVLEWESDTILNFLFKAYETKIKAYLYERIEAVKAHMLKKFQGEAILTDIEFLEMVKILPSFLKIKYKSIKVVFEEIEGVSSPMPSEEATPIPEKNTPKKALKVLFFVGILAILGVGLFSYFKNPSQADKNIEGSLFQEREAKDLFEARALENTQAKEIPLSEPKASLVEIEMPKQEIANSEKELENKKETQAIIEKVLPKKEQKLEVVEEKLKYSNYFIQIYMPKSAKFENICTELKKIDNLLYIDTKEVLGRYEIRITELKISVPMDINNLKKHVYTILSKNIKGLRTEDIKIREFSL